MNSANEIMISRIKEQAFDTISSMVAGKKEVDAQVLIQTIQNQKMMVDFTVASVLRMEKEQTSSL